MTKPEADSDPDARGSVAASIINASLSRLRTRCVQHTVTCTQLHSNMRVKNR